MTKKASARNRRARSPRAPRLDLELALSMARRFYDKEPTRSAPSEVVIEHWGYSSKSSSGPIALSTLRGFGLIEVHGNEIRLTELALDILQDGRAESPKRIRSIRRAALYPKIHATVSEHYGGTIPSDETLRFYLLRDQGFTDKGADVFVKQFRATLAFAFAGIENGVRLPKGEGEEKEGGSATSERYPPPQQGGIGAQVPASRSDVLTPRPTMNQDTFTVRGGQITLQFPATNSRETYEDLKECLSLWLKLMEKRTKQAVAADGDKETESSERATSEFERPSLPLMARRAAMFALRCAGAFQGCHRLGRRRSRLRAPGPPDRDPMLRLVSRWPRNGCPSRKPC